MASGVYKRTEENCRNLSKNRKGKKDSKEAKKRKRENNARYWKGRKKSKEHLKKIGETRKRHYAEGLFVHPFFGKKRPEMYGEKNPMWKGGRSVGYKTGYWSAEYKRWRMAVFERDSFTCQFCGIKGVYITAHHIKSFTRYPELKYDIDNGVTLCQECHSLTDNYRYKKKK